MGIVVGGCRQAEISAHVIAVAQNNLLVLGLNIVELRQAVAAHGVVSEIDIGQTQIALIGILISELQLQLHGMGRAIRGVAQFGIEVADIEPRVIRAAIDRLKAIRLPLMGF